MIPTFDVFVGVDWSGARKSYDGIAIARCDGQSRAAPTLFEPNRRWRRTDFVEWLAPEAMSGKRLLVGIDCAFALPEKTVRTMLRGEYTAFKLWEYVDKTCGDAEDFYGGGFAEHGAHRDHFRWPGWCPPNFVEHHRATECACKSAKCGSPQSTLKLIGPRQVGKGGLAGMRVLAALRRRLGADLAVWPFEGIERARVVCAEVFPRLFLQMAKHDNTKVRDRDTLNRCLGKLESDAYAGSEEKFKDHETDALVTSAGLRHIVGDPSIWAPAGLDPLARRAEGWILGVR